MLCRCTDALYKYLCFIEVPMLHRSTFAPYKYLCSIYFLKRKQDEDVHLAALAISTEKSSFESSTLDWSAQVLT